MLKYCWTLYYNLPWNDISFIIYLFNHSYSKLAITVTYIYVNKNNKWIVPLIYKYFFPVLHYTLLEIKWHEFCPLKPRFRIAWKLMYRYSMSIACVFTPYLVFVASYTVSTFVFVLFSSRSCWRTNKMTSRTAFFQLVQAQRDVHLDATKTRSWYAN